MRLYAFAQVWEDERVREKESDDPIHEPLLNTSFNYMQNERFPVAINSFSSATKLFFGKNRGGTGARQAVFLLYSSGGIPDPQNPELLEEYKEE